MSQLTIASVPELLRLAESVAHEAGEYARSIDRADLVLDSKTNEMDIVTQVDTRNERVIRETVLRQFPDHEFLGEELGGSTSANTMPNDGRQHVRWIIDPVDGTVNFAHGLPIWCVSVGVEVNGVVECGAIYHPHLNEMFTAVRGGGAFLNGAPIRVSKQVDPKKGLFVTGFPYNVDENPYSVIENFAKFLRKGLLVRRLGSAALDLAYVACGRFDGFWEAGLSPWDSSVGDLLVREAGGIVTHYDGSPYNIYEKGIIATNGVQHELIRSTLAEPI